MKLDLFKLKSRENLLSVQIFFSKHLKKYFNDTNEPILQYFDKKDCPLCSSSDRSIAYSIDNFDYYTCNNCQSIYTFPFLKEEIINEMYSSGAYEEYQKRLVNNSQGVRKDLLDKRKIQQIEKLLPNKGSLLDVGCGQGSFLKSCKDAGWNVTGIDPSIPAAQKARENYDIKVITGLFSDLDETSKYDCITFWGVLEHVITPLRELKKASSLCTPGGIIQFEVPSSDCLLSQYLKTNPFPATRFIESGRHNIFFSLKAINWMLKEAGLELAYIESNGLDIQTILMEELSSEATDKILNIQDTLNNILLGDHYRVFARKI